MSESVFQLGYVDFDAHPPQNASVGIIVAAEHEKLFRRNVYVGIHDREQGLEFLGRIVGGPFHTPHAQPSAPVITEAPALNPDQPPSRQSYHVYGTVEILGQLIESKRIVPTPTRPRPYSEIYLFPDHRLRQFLGIEGDFYLGAVNGHANIKVKASSTNKNFLPRNVGIFGTVGSGKSNTAQVLAEEATKTGWAVVLIDVEGEYVRMNEPIDDPHLIGILRNDYQLSPNRMDDFHVYVPSSGRTGATSPIPFKVPISALDPMIVADILEFTEAELRVFGMITQQASLRYAPSPSSPGEPQRRPYNLQHLIDGLVEGPAIDGNPTIRLLPLAKLHDISSASVLRSKLLHLGRSHMLDGNETTDVLELPMQALLVGGRLSVLDVSETDDRSRNLAIAYVLQGLFEHVIATPKGERMPSGAPRPPLLVIVEEVHTFVSRATAPKMKAVLDNLQVISRRGRKRWMALALVSQQPNHVPDEIFELTNTRFIHQVKSLSNLAPLKQTTDGVDETLWSNVPAMGPGQCLLTGSVFKNPLFINVRPAQSHRLLVT